MTTLESLAQAASILPQTVSTLFAPLDLSALNFKTAPDSWTYWSAWST